MVNNSMRGRCLCAWSTMLCGWAKTLVTFVISSGYVTCCDVATDRICFSESHLYITALPVEHGKCISSLSHSHRSVFIHFLLTLASDLHFKRHKGSYLVLFTYLFFIYCAKTDFLVLEIIEL